MKGIFRALPPLEQLESRLCLSTFEYQALSDYLNVQSLIAELNAPSGSNAGNFGVSIVNLSDIDADGIPDFAIGADGTSGSAPVAGQVFLFSGRTRELIRTLSDGQTGFGRTLANLGDVNGDGAPDLAVGSAARGDVTGTFGAVLAYSGADGATLWEVVGDGPVGELGRALAAVRDLDNDGIGDLAVGGRVGSKGEVRALSGTTGALIWTAYAGDDNVSFGESLAPVTKFIDSHAQFVDLAVAAGAPEEGGGTVRLLGLAGEELSKFTGTGRYGASLTSVVMGNAANPQQEFLIIGAPDVSTGTLGASQGEVEIRTLLFDNGGQFGVNALPIVEGSLGTYFATWLAPLGALEFAVGYTDGAGIARVRPFELSRNVGSHVEYGYRALNTTDQFRGVAAADVGDTDGNGFSDFLLGASPAIGTARVIDSGLSRIAPVLGVQGGSSNGRWLWSDEFLIKDLKLYARSIVPGLTDEDTVFGISDDASVAVVSRFVQNKVEFTYIRAVQRLTIDQAITSTVGGTVDTNLLIPVKVGAGGHILFNVTHPSIREASTAWVLDPDGTLRFLWNGVAADVNASGTVVGTRFLPNDGNEAVEYSAGVVSAVPGLGGAQAINNAGDVAGWADTNEIVIVKAGVPMVVGHVNSLTGASGVATWAGVTHLDDSDRLVGLVDYPGQARHLLYYSAETGMVLGDLLTVGAPGPLKLSEDAPFAIDGAGRPLAASYALALVDDRTVFNARDLETRVVVTGSDGLQVVATDAYGEPVVFTRDGAGDWHAKDARTGFQVAPDQPGLVSWVDPVDGLTYVVYITDRYPSNTTAMLRDGAGTLGAPGIWGMNVHGQAWNPFVSGLVLFTSTDGLVHIAGRDAQGHLVMMSRNLVDMADADAWTYADLTADHLMFQGLNTPEWVGTPVAYVTPWNGQNIAGLDADGHVQVVWWAPGMTLWTVSDLSTIAAAPALVGGITAFTTAWGAVNIVGNVASGDLTAIWWAPALGGQWLTSSLSEAAGSSITLRADTLTSYVQPWGALNVAGIDQNGGVTIFWWSFNSNQWTASTVTPDVSTVPFPSGPLSSGVLPDGAAHLGGVSASGDVIDLSWEPGGSWILEDLTQAAV